MNVSMDVIHANPAVPMEAKLAVGIVMVFLGVLVLIETLSRSVRKAPTEESCCGHGKVRNDPPGDVAALPSIQPDHLEAEVESLQSEAQLEGLARRGR